MYTVLLPVDADEDRALRQATFVRDLPAGADELSVHVLFVFTEGMHSRDVPEELKRFDSANRVQSVRRTVDTLDDAGIHWEIVEDSGEVAADILDVAEDLDADLIVLGGRKRSPAGKILFGSVTQEVLLNSDRPVTVTGASKSS
jgi:nucleotide-binding universal stress UspA family protein